VQYYSEGTALSNDKFTPNWKSIIFNGFIPAFLMLVISLIFASFTLPNDYLLEKRQACSSQGLLYRAGMTNNTQKTA